MRKLLLLIALGFVMLSSCNNGQTKGAAEDIDSIALRAKTDTVLSFNGIALGDTVLADVNLWEVGKPTDIATESYNVPLSYTISGDFLNAGESPSIFEKYNIKVREIQISYQKADTSIVKEIVKLYTKKYGKFSYYKETKGYKDFIKYTKDKVDSLSHNSYLNSLLKKAEKQNDENSNAIVWEWSNCSITMFFYCYHSGSYSFHIHYSDTGSEYRLSQERDEEESLKKKAKQQDI